MPADFHTHTTFSDASCPIEQLPRLAKKAGLTALAVSDHDTAKAIQFAHTHKTMCGVKLVPATELTAHDKVRDRSVHILCYYPALTEELCAFFDDMAQARTGVAEKSMPGIEALYPQFDPEVARAYAKDAGVIHKAHIMRVLYDYAHTDGIYKDLFKKLSHDGVLYDPECASVETVLDIAHRAGAVVVLAHPSVYNSMDLAHELAQKGLIDGVEIEHPRNKPEDKKVLYALAKEYDLIVTGGSDFHGICGYPSYPVGICTTSDEAVARIEALAQTRKQDLGL